MSSDRKQRHQNQIIGAQGEKFFAAWVQGIGYSANKAEEDYGIDFFCQKFENRSPTSQVVSGEILLVQVRATTQDRIKLDKEDIATALALQAPYCLVAVSTPQSAVYFRMLDEKLLDEWSAFMQSGKKNKTYRLDTFDTDPQAFVRGHLTISKPKFRQKVAMARATTELNSDIPGASFQYAIQNEAAISATTFPLLTSAFDTSQPGHQEELAKILFRPTPFLKAFDEALGRVPIKDSVEAMKDLVDGPHAWFGEAETEADLVVSLNSTEVTRPFRMRRVKDERAYISRSGLVIKISDAFEMEGKHVHRMGSFASSTDAANLESSGDMAFLKQLRSTAMINETGRPLIPVEKFGLDVIGAAVSDIERVSEHLNIPLAEFYLADLHEQEFCARLSLILHLLDNRTEGSFLPGFVVDVSPTEQLDETLWEPCDYSVPIFMKLKQNNICAVVSGTGEAYVESGFIRGFRFEEPTSTTVSTITDNIPGDGTPVACYVKDWPRIKVIGSQVDTAQLDDFPGYGQFTLL